MIGGAPQSDQTMHYQRMEQYDVNPMRINSIPQRKEAHGSAQVRDNQAMMANNIFIDSGFVNFVAHHSASKAMQNQSA